MVVIRDESTPFLAKRSVKDVPNFTNDQGESIIQIKRDFALEKDLTDSLGDPKLSAFPMKRPIFPVSISAKSHRLQSLRQSIPEDPDNYAPTKNIKLKLNLMKSKLLDLQPPANCSQSQTPDATHQDLLKVVQLQDDYIKRLESGLLIAVQQLERVTIQLRAESKQKPEAQRVLQASPDLSLSSVEELGFE